MSVVNNDEDICDEEDLNEEVNDIEDEEASFKIKEEPVDANVWTLPADKDVCTLEEIRRGQVINKTAANECPVLGCGKKINETRAEPSPGTISSGLRTHVLFVHYADRRAAKKRKLGWTTKRRQTSPRKQPPSQSSTRSSPSHSELDFDAEPENCSVSNLTCAGLNLMQKSFASPNRSSMAPGSIINKKVKQLAAKSKALQLTSHQSLMQATGGGSGSSGIPRFSSQETKQKIQDSNNSQKNLNPAASSLFSILAGLTQQPQQQQQQTSRNVKTAHGTNTINISQCSKNLTNNNHTNQPVNSSLLTLLNEKISGNVASSLHSQLKKSFGNQIKLPTTATSTPRQNLSSPANNSYFQTNNICDEPNSFNNGSSILNNLCATNNDNRPSSDSSLSLNSFIELVAIKTGSNIGSAGIAEAKKIVEKFTMSLICSAQTIADHYLAPFAGEVPQHKPEISPSDVMLAYKMMHKSHTQP